MPVKILSITSPSKRREKYRTRPDGYKTTQVTWHDPDGTRHVKSLYAKTDVELDGKRLALQLEIQKGLRITQGQASVEAWCTRWLEMQADRRMEPREYGTYKREVQRVVDRLGKRRLVDIVPSDVQSILNSRIGMSGSAIKKTAFIIRRLFADAVADRLITYNPCDSLRVPAGEDGSHRLITPAERQLIQDTWQGHRMGLGALLMLYAGLRRGELVALQWKHIDLANREIHIENATAYISNKAILKGTKTAAGARTVPIVKPLYFALQSIDFKHDDYILSASRSHGIMTETAIRKAWAGYQYYLGVQQTGCNKRWCEHKNMTWHECDIRMHDLRHTYCTDLYYAGVDLKTAQYLMGHRDVKTTMRIYTHLDEIQKEKAFLKLREYYEVGNKVGITENDSAETIDIASK